jgi:hypothetical protein
MIDYQSKFDFNLQYLDSPLHDLYNKSLLEFYNKDSICDDSDITKSNKDGVLLIKCKKSGYFLKIIDAKYVDINKQLIIIRKQKKILKTNIEKLLIHDDIKHVKDNFIKIKDEYIELTKEEEYIKNVFNIQKNKLNDIDNNINELLSELMILFLKRKELYNKINNKRLKYNKKEFILKLLKANTTNNISEETIHKLSLKIKVDKDDTKYWIYWIKNCIKYIYLKLKLQKEYKIKQDLSAKYENINRFFIINEPSVDKSKNIEIKKGGTIQFMNGGDMFADPASGHRDNNNTSDIELEITEDNPVMEEDHQIQSGGDKQIDSCEEDSSEHYSEGAIYQQNTENLREQQAGYKYTNDYSSLKKMNNKDISPQVFDLNNIKHKVLSNNNIKQIHIDTPPIISTPQINSNIIPQRHHKNPNINNNLKHNIYTNQLGMGKKPSLSNNDNIKVVRIKASDLVSSY